MKKIILSSFLLISIGAHSQAFQYKIITTIESVVPGGIGRSRIIENGTEVDTLNLLPLDRKTEKINQIKTGVMLKLMI